MSRNAGYLNNIFTQNITAGTGASSSAGTANGQYTLGELWNAEGAFTAVRLVLFNDTNTAMKCDGMTVCPTSQPNALVDEAGAALTPVQVTFSNNGADVSFAQQMVSRTNATVTSATSLSIPACAVNNAFTPVLAYSDWMPLVSVRRTDGGFGGLLQIRSLVNAGDSLRATQLPTSFNATTGSFYGVVPRTVDAWYAPGDFVTGAPAFASTRNGNGFTCYAVQFVMVRPALNVQIVGESVLAGWGTPTKVDGFVQQACAALSRPDAPVVCFSSAIGGQTYSDAVKSGLGLLKANRIGAAVMASWDGNDALPSDASFAVAKAHVDAQWSLMTFYASQVRAAGGVPIFVSPVPNAQSLVQEQGRLYARQRVLDARLLGWPVIDVEPILGAMNPPPVYSATVPPTVANTFKPSAGSPDGIHPGPAGHAMLANTIMPELRAILDGIYEPPF